MVNVDSLLPLSAWGSLAFEPEDEGKGVKRGVAQFISFPQDGQRLPLVNGKSMLGLTKQILKFDRRNNPRLGLGTEITREVVSIHLNQEILTENLALQGGAAQEKKA